MKYTAPSIQYQSGDLIHDRYRVLKSLGEGSMGEVLLVYDQFVDRPVAIKLLKSHISVDEEHLLRFIDEAKCQARLQHPGVISVYDIGRAENGQLFFTMRAVSGKGFDNLIKDIHNLTGKQGIWSIDERGWSFRRLIQALKQCADAVGFAHSQGIVHRDLKPQNLLIGPHGDPLVLDWGIAKYLGSDFQPSNTEQLNLFVTPTPVPQSSSDHVEQAEAGSLLEVESETIDLAGLGYERGELPETSEAFSIDQTPIHDFMRPLEDLHSDEFASIGSSDGTEVSSLPDWLISESRHTQSMRLVYEELNATTGSGIFKSVSTLAGTITGTPAYMSPEQASGRSSEVDPTTDVYALGCILYHILCGSPPYRGRSLLEVLDKVKVGDFAQLLHNPKVGLPSPSIEEIKEQGKLPQFLETAAPQALISICARAMSFKNEDRYASASDFAEALGDWINGVQQQQEALLLLAELKPIRAQQAELETSAQSLDRQAQLILKLLPSWANEDEKAAAWDLEDQAKEKRQEIEALDFQVELRLQSARSLAGDLVELHQEAADHYLSSHIRLVDAQREQEAKRAIAYLAEHAESLPNDHPNKERYLRYLKGEGSFSLTLGSYDQISLFPETLRMRRLVRGNKISCDQVSLTQSKLSSSHSILQGTHPAGSYLLSVKRGSGEFMYPMSLDQRASWSSHPPLDTRTGQGRILRVPPEHWLDVDDIFIPAGWCRVGDLEAPRAVPPMQLWVDSFVARRFPVTHREYLVFLNELARSGRVEEALRHAPQEMSTSSEHKDSLLYEYDEVSGFRLPLKTSSLNWSPNSPVVMVTWWDACAYANWYANRTKKPWRLLSEWEWEKAARGVDGRAYPWGDYIDPSWCCNRLSHQSDPGTQEVDSFPVDQSPYGLRGMAGNTADWTLSPHEDEPEIVGGSLAPKPDLQAALETELPARVAKGGAWDDGPAFCHSAVRHRGVSQYRRLSLTFRIAFSVSQSEEEQWDN